MKVVVEMPKGVFNRSSSKMKIRVEARRREADQTIMVV